MGLAVGVQTNKLSIDCPYVKLLKTKSVELWGYHYAGRALRIISTSRAERSSAAEDLSAESRTARGPRRNMRDTANRTLFGTFEDSGIQ